MRELAEYGRFIGPIATLPFVVASTPTPANDARQLLDNQEMRFAGGIRAELILAASALMVAWFSEIGRAHV